MMNFLLEWQKGMESLNQNGQYFALILGILLFFYLIKPKEKLTFQKYTFLMVFLLFFPLTTYIILWYRTEFYRFSDLWNLLSVTIIIAFGLCEISNLLEQKNNWQKKKKKWILNAGIVLLVSLCGTVSPLYTKSEWGTGFTKMGEEEFKVLEIISENQDWEEACVWAPNEIVESARGYDGNLRLLYGKDMWNHELHAYTYDVYDDNKKKLYEWMNINWYKVQADSLTVDMSAKEAFYLAREYGCDLLVIYRNQLEAKDIREFLEESDQTLLVRREETEKYIIYEYQE